MLPMMTMKNYSRFVTDYLAGLIKEHANKVKKRVKVIYASHFLRFLDALFVTSQSLNKELQGTLINQYQAIKVIHQCCDCPLRLPASACELSERVRPPRQNPTA